MGLFYANVQFIGGTNATFRVPFAPWRAATALKNRRILKMFLPPSSGSVILSLAHLRTLDRAFSSGGERFPDTEEVRSSNLLTPTKCSQLRGFAFELFCFTPPNQESPQHPRPPRQRQQPPQPRPMPLLRRRWQSQSSPNPLPHRQQAPQPSQNRPNGLVDRPNQARMGLTATSDRPSYNQV